MVGRCWKTVFLSGRPFFRGYASLREGNAFAFWGQVCWILVSEGCRLNSKTCSRPFVCLVTHRSHHTLYVWLLFVVLQIDREPWRPGLDENRLVAREPDLSSQVARNWWEDNIQSKLMMMGVGDQVGSTHTEIRWEIMLITSGCANKKSQLSAITKFLPKCYILVVISRHVLYRVVETCIHYNPRNTALTQGTLASQIYWLVDLGVYKNDNTFWFSLVSGPCPEPPESKCLQLSCFWFSWFFWSLWSGATWNLGPIHELPFSWIPWTHFNTPYLFYFPGQFRVSSMMRLEYIIQILCCDLEETYSPNCSLY